MKKWPLFLLCLLVNSSKASMEQAYQEGTALTENLKNRGAQNTQVKVDKDRVPGFEGVSPPQTELGKQGDLSKAIQETLKCSEAGQALIESSDKRLRYKLDPETDPLFSVPSEKSMQEALAIEEADIKLEKEAPSIQLCEEGGEEVSYTCDENREVIPQVPMKTATLTVNHLEFQKNMESYQVRVKKRWWRHSKLETRERENGWKLSLPKEIDAFRRTFCQGFDLKDLDTGKKFNLDCSRIQNFKINNASSLSESGGNYNIVTPEKELNITLFHDTYEGEESDRWGGQCDEYEKQVEQGLCQYGERTLSQGPETRTIQGYRIFKDAWQYQKSYHCKMIKEGCSALKAQGCYQVSSKCKEKRQGKCWIFEQGYECPSHQIRPSSTTVSGVSNLFCLTGSCQDASYSANQEMLDIVTRLSMLKEVQNDIRSQQTLRSFEIFKGAPRACSRNCLSFKDCCGGMNGWGVSVHLSSCSEEEKQLAKLRGTQLCTLVGTYCTEKVLKKCIRKKTVFCCFPSRFSRLLQEQGRAQLGLGFGEPQSPNCRGFTVEEVSRINFSKLDMRELFNEVMQKYQAPNVEALQKKTAEQLQENLKHLQPEKRPSKEPKTGVILDHKNL